MATSGIGKDIRDVIFSLCTEIKYPEKDNIIERIDYESNTQATKPQTAEHFLLTTFVNDSIVEPGDLVQFTAASTFYRVMNVFLEVFENQPIYKQCILYKCNVSATVYYPTTERDPRTLANKETFVVRQESVDIVAMMTDKLYATRLDDEEQDIIQQAIAGKVLYFPKKYPIVMKDRVIINGEIPYEVTSIESNTFPGMHVVYLEEDTRSTEYDHEVPVRN